MTVTLDDIKAAQARIGNQITATPCLPSRTLSALVGAELVLKFENLQFTASFKERGALNRLLNLAHAERRKGVSAMSAGNHGQAVAYHASRLGVPAVVVMPRHTPFVKVEHTRNHGAEVVLAGDTLDEAHAQAQKITAERDLTFIHPYDDPHVIAGQGTLGLEIAAAVPDLQALVVPVGGGGLISGVATAVKELLPHVEVIGVQTAGYPSMAAALKGEQVQCQGDTIAEGIAVKSAGRITREIIRDRVDEIVLVDEDDLERGVALLLNIEKTVAEGAGAAALAAVLRDPGRFKGRKVGLIVSGGNIDPRLLASVIMRELVREQRIVKLHIPIADHPGVLSKITTVVGAEGGNILEVFHHRLSIDMPAKAATLDILVEARDGRHAAAVVEALRAAGFNPSILPP
jgi:threonine dehydratase